MKVISNSTPLIALSRIGELELLHSLFDNIIIPCAVFNEVVLEGAGRPGVKEVKNASWIIKAEVANQLAVSLLESDLDRGECEAIVLAKELNADYLLLDERKARRIIRNSGIKVMGTLGVLGLAAKNGLLTDFDNVFQRLGENGFRFKPAVTKEVKNYFIK
ncbi:MAG: DUF3368 domain-containing protein [Firmicutes bacterium]|nr:DUF3368 domain-containing protein [Bacillota bacterium]